MSATYLQLTQDKELQMDAKETKFAKLRRFNAIMGFLHLIQGIFMIAVSNDTAYPIYTNCVVVEHRGAFGSRVTF